MTTLLQGGRGSASLQVGEKLVVSAGTGTGTIVPFDAGQEPGTPIAFTGAALEIGPFDYIQEYRLECFTGEMTFTEDQTIADVRKRGSNAAPKTGAAYPSRSTTIELFSGASLSVIATMGAGLLVELLNSAEPGSVTFFSNTSFDLGPFDADKRYFLGCTAGEVTYSQRLSVGGVSPTPTPTPTPAYPNLITYGRTANYDAGTAGDIFVDGVNGSNANDGTSPALAKATVQAGRDAAVALGGARVVRVMGDGHLYRETLTLTGDSNITIASYGTDIPIITGAARLTGFTQCGAGDETLLGAGYANIYKTTINIADVLDHTSFHALFPTENGTPLNLAQRRADTSRLFSLGNPVSMYSSGFTPTYDGVSAYSGDPGPGDMITLTHAAVIGTYSDAQLAKAMVAWHSYPNRVSYMKPSSVSGGVMTFPQPSVDGQNARNATTPRYALLNVLPALAQGHYGFSDNGDGTVTIYVYPNNIANLDKIDVCSRVNAVQLTNCTNCVIEGIGVGGTSSDSQASGIPLQVTGGSDNIVKQILVKNFSHYDAGHAARIQGGTRNKIIQSTAQNGQSCYGFALVGSGGNSVDCRVMNNLIEDIDQSPFRIFGSTRPAIIHNKARRCCYGAHANQTNFYLGCIMALVIGWLPDTGTADRLAEGYATNQALTGGSLWLNSVFTISTDGRAYTDQNGGGESGENYLINSLAAHHPAVTDGAAQSAFLLGTNFDTDVSNWSVFNCVVPDITFRNNSGAKSTTLTRRNNVLTKGATGHASETQIIDLLALFKDAAAGDFNTVPDSPLRSLAGYDVSSVITTYQAAFPDVAGYLIQDAYGYTWNPADPGVGPWGKNWPIATDVTAPVISALANDVTGANASVTLSTTEHGGTLYWATLASGANVPSALALIAGTGFTNAGDQAVTATGTQTIDVTGEAGVTNLFAVVHVDRHGNVSNVLSGNLEFESYVPTWRYLPLTTTYLNRGSSLSNRQALSRSFFLAISMKRNTTDRAISTTGGLMNTGVPSTRAHAIDIINTGTNRILFEDAITNNNTILGGTQPFSAALAADEEAVYLVGFTSTATTGPNVLKQGLAKVATGLFVAGTNGGSAADHAINMDFTFVRFGIGAMSIERVMLWDNAYLDPTLEATYRLFVGASGGLVDPAVAVAALGTPLINIFGTGLTAAVNNGDVITNSGNGGNFTLVKP